VTGLCALLLHLAARMYHNKQDCNNKRNNKTANFQIRGCHFCLLEYSDDSYGRELPMFRKVVRASSLWSSIWTPSWTAWSCKWRPCHTPIRCEQLTYRHFATSQKIWVCNK